MNYKKIITNITMILIPLTLSSCWPGKTNNDSNYTLPSQSEKTTGYATVMIDPARVQLLGITTEKIKIRNLTKTIRTVGIVTVDERSIAHIQTKFNGWIEELFVDFIGMPVQCGQKLFSVYSPELVATQEEYLIALQALNQPIEGRFATEFKLSNESLVRATQQRLTLWNISPEQITQLEREKIPTKTLIFRSPINGIVLDKTAFIGMNVGPGMNTYTIADLSYVWILADIYEDNMDIMRLGQRAELTLLSLPGKIYKGKITFIDYVAQASTRTLKVRFEFNNNDYRLKPGMYATVKTSLSMGKKLALPEEALINTGERKIVFVAKSNGHFEPRQVKLGFKAGPYYQILSGLKEKENVVTSAQFLLDSESRLKALGTGKMKGHGI